LMLRVLVPRASRLVLPRSSVRCVMTSMDIEPYSGMQLASTKVAPMLADVPSELDETKIPQGYSLLNFKDMGMGSVMCVPNNWHLAEVQDQIPDHMLHSDVVPRWVISKEDTLNNENMQTGVNVLSYKHIIGAPHDLIKQIEENLFGKSDFYFRYCNEKGIPLDKEYLRDGYGVGHLFTGDMDLGNRYRSVIELELYQRSTSNAVNAPLADYYSYTDIFYWKKERWVMIFTYQCPLEEKEQSKPILDTIRNHSILNYTSPFYKVEYPKMFSVEPYPKE